MRAIGNPRVPVTWVWALPPPMCPSPRIRNLMWWLLLHPLTIPVLMLQKPTIWFCEPRAALQLHRVLPQSFWSYLPLPQWIMSFVVHFLP